MPGIIFQCPNDGVQDADGTLCDTGSHTIIISRLTKGHVHDCINLSYTKQLPVA